MPPFERIPKVGTTFKLKPKRADAYGFARDAEYTVTRLHYRKGYLIPFVVSDDKVFKLSDLK